MNVENSVLERYSKGAESAEPSLCCAVDYDNDLLRILPEEVIEKDYGCGDPSRYIREGDLVLDLGSGSGKICYIAAQLVGERGGVIGVDMNDDMLSLARRYQSEMAKKIGSDRVSFRKAYIQDLRLDLEAVDRYLSDHPIGSSAQLARFNAWKSERRLQSPLIADNSVDLVVSNCVLNLVEEADKRSLLDEIFRVTKPGGRVAIADIVSDEPVPGHLKADPLLWSGCISGAMQEQSFVNAFVEAGFQGVCIAKWDDSPWRTIEGIEFRSVTVTAFKGQGSECLDKGHAVIYRGPFSQIHDDDGHYYPRAERIAVCERTFNMLIDRYPDDFIGISPALAMEAKTWCAPAGTTRPARDTKGAAHRQNVPGGNCCC
ncbi:MAG: methyltransferase domain-containing protein [Methylococcaceae bacterium]|nr:methyltransferase domain-containing protein [Methylococcaceae bacterium]MCI0667229.1 methyltransferase domain-containing protein [Methylococcaceae bacterium]